MKDKIELLKNNCFYIQEAIESNLQRLSIVKKILEKITSGKIAEDDIWGILQSSLQEKEYIEKNVRRLYKEGELTTYLLSYIEVRLKRNEEVSMIEIKAIVADFFEQNSEMDVSKASHLLNCLQK